MSFSFGAIFSRFINLFHQLAILHAQYINNLIIKMLICDSHDFVILTIRKMVHIYADIIFKFFLKLNDCILIQNSLYLWDWLKNILSLL